MIRGNRMKRVLALLSIVVAAVCLAVPANAAPRPDTPPPLNPVTAATMSDGKAAVAAVSNATIGWSVYYGNGYNYAPVVYSNRNPTWKVTAGNPYEMFQPDCNFVIYLTAGGGPIWASNSVAQLRPCTMSWQMNGEVVMRNSVGQIGWRTNTAHTGQVQTAMALYDTGCEVVYYWNVPTQHWVNSWRTNLTADGIDCASYTG